MILNAFSDTPLPSRTSMLQAPVGFMARSDFYPIRPFAQAEGKVIKAFWSSLFGVRARRVLPKWAPLRLLDGQECRRCMPWTSFETVILCHRLRVN